MRRSQKVAEELLAPPPRGAQQNAALRLSDACREAVGIWRGSAGVHIAPWSLEKMSSVTFLLSIPLK